MPPKVTTGGNGGKAPAPRRGGGGGRQPTVGAAPAARGASGTRRSGSTSRGRGTRPSRAIPVSSGDDEEEVVRSRSRTPPPHAAPTTAVPDDPSLADDLAEAHALGIDEDFVEQLRLMSPRSRITILTDLRGQVQRDIPQPPPPPPPPQRRGGPLFPPLPAHAASAVPPVTYRQAPNRQPAGAAGRRRGGRGAQRGGDDDDRWDPPHYGAMHDFMHGGFDSEEDDHGDGDWEQQFMFQRPPAGAAGRGGRGAHGGGGPQPLVFDGPAAMLLHAMMRGGGMSVQGRDQMARILAEAQRAAHEAHAMGAGLDVDNMSYEELLALEDRIGHVSKGLTADQLRASTEVVPAPSTPSPSKSSGAADADADSCVICMTEFTATPDNDCRKIYRCGHLFHDVCLSTWLRDNRRCPICNLDVV